MSTTEATVKDDGAFFDDDNNKAMFLVLPAMIVIYGSCCLIYCIHKCRRYCVTQKKKKRKMMTAKRNKIGGSQGFHNAALILHDETDPNLVPGIRGPRKAPTAHPPELVLENLDADATAKQVAPSGRTSRMFQETDVDSLADVLQREKLDAVAPGYSGTEGYNTGNLSQEMQHLDNQLKVAFRLVNPTSGKEPPKAPQQDDLDMTSYPSKETLTAYANWKALQRTDLPKLTLKTTPAGDTVVERIPKKRRMIMINNGRDVAEEDLHAMAQVRETLAKEIPKSMPDIFRKPDENSLALKKMSSISKRRIFLSSQ